MSNLLKTYSSKDANITWGVVDFYGLSSDNFLTITPNADVLSMSVSADSYVSYGINANQTQTCTITLEQQSPTNNLLAGILDFQLTTGNIIYTADLFFEDFSGSNFIELKDCVLFGKPELSYGESVEGSTRTWTFMVSRVKYRAAPTVLDDITRTTYLNQLDNVLAMINQSL